MRALTDVEAHVVLRRFDPVDLLGSHEHAAPPVFDEETMGRPALRKPRLERRGKRATRLEVAMVVVRVHHREDRPIGEDIPVIEDRKGVHQLLREGIRLARRRVQQVLHPYRGNEMQQREIEARPEVDEEVAAEAGSVHPKAPREPRHDR